MYIDMWYGDKVSDCTRITQSFNDITCKTCGWLIKGDKIVGDYSSDDSVEVQEYFEKFGFVYS